ncbi:outer membrane lipoprotein carrier protein LolA [Roseomonas sp. NAR14]|uniref:Outer membrane lipoprotein carrier protein LolA n=1 Tax=Roseomonas acroporae TaxID=2937791 RepID=A0A9X1YBA3_9PROT|nr:outer membrane lipoprotein carrier protein LolA [Roseomonas acroporae]MCK8783376.1 outer membrane lipoprotein carrier protein LolA [Roseomonas acroporae]
MRRRLLLLSPALLAAPAPLRPALAQRAPGGGAPGAAAPGATPGVPLAGAARDAALQRVEAYLNGLVSLKARFLQIAYNGAAAEGTAWIVRPGKMRFEYDPPEPLLMVASHGQFFYYDRELAQPTTVPVNSTPLGILLRANLRLSGDITVSQVTRDSSVLRVTLYRTASPGEGRLTLVFSENPMELKQWAVLDAQGRETRVSLSQTQVGGRFDDFLFEFNDPRFQEELRGRR